MICNRRLVLAGAAAFGLSARTTFAQPAAAPSIDTRLYKEGPLIVRDRFSVEVVGKGPDLIFVPGLSSSRETWKVTADRLRGRYRLHLFQLAGFAGEGGKRRTGFLRQVGRKGSALGGVGSHCVGSRLMVSGVLLAKRSPSASLRPHRRTRGRAPRCPSTGRCRRSPSRW